MILTATVIDVAAWATVIAAVLSITIALVGLGFVILQLRGANAAARAQATIAFQAAFKESQPARRRLLRSFPIHVSLLAKELDVDPTQVATWSSLSDLCGEQREAATAVVNALNDVVQYVADGLALKSALQQYHVPFVQAGFLLAPYIEALNTPDGARRPTRIGVRVIDLRNAALGYHLCHPKHHERELKLTRPAIDGSRDVVLRLVQGTGWHVPFCHEYSPGGRHKKSYLEAETAAGVPKGVDKVVKATERELRGPRRWWRL